jgi:hypothetical protein
MRREQARNCGKKHENSVPNRMAAHEKIRFPRVFVKLEKAIRQNALIMSAVFEQPVPIFLRTGQ